MGINLYFSYLWASFRLLLGLQCFEKLYFCGKIGSDFALSACCTLNWPDVLEYQENDESFC